MSEAIRNLWPRVRVLGRLALVIIVAIVPVVTLASASLAESLESPTYGDGVPITAKAVPGSGTDPSAPNTLERAYDPLPPHYVASPLPAAPYPHWPPPVDAGPRPAGAIDMILVNKSERRLYLLSQGNVVVRNFAVALGHDPVGDKRRAGDGRTPEGEYQIDWRNDRSRYYKSLHVSYPNEEDVTEARQSGFDPGGGIMIHGLPNGLGVIGDAHDQQDWTDGCIAVTNQEMDEIWSLVEDGTEIEIRP